jgi:hypothetical protein
LPYLIGTILDALGDLGLAIDDPFAERVPVSETAQERLDAVREAMRRWWALP